MSRRDRPDYYSARARAEGYRARSVYKLQEIQTRFGVLGAGDAVLDVGAAPGSWSQLAAKIVGSAGRVVSVDLSALDALAGITTVTPIVGDIYDPTVIEAIRGHGPYSVVLSDAAPNTTGNRTVDTGRSAALVEHVLWLAVSLLRPGGNLVAKLFQGGDEQALLAAVRADYASGRIVKPKASRSESFECFLVGLGRRGTAQRG